MTDRASYVVYRAPGWHGEPDDPVIMETDDYHEAALRAGLRADLGMPGDCAPYDAYALDHEGEVVTPEMSYWCDECEVVTPWGDGPVGVWDGRIHPCPASLPSHLVLWLCEACAQSFIVEGGNGNG